jgi:hypothetical protein
MNPTGTSEFAVLSGDAPLSLYTLHLTALDECRIADNDVGQKLDSQLLAQMLNRRHKYQCHITKGTAAFLAGSIMAARSRPFHDLGSSLIPLLRRPPTWILWRIGS